MHGKQAVWCACCLVVTWSRQDPRRGQLDWAALRSLPDALSWKPERVPSCMSYLTRWPMGHVLTREDWPEGEGAGTVPRQCNKSPLALQEAKASRLFPLAEADGPSRASSGDLGAPQSGELAGHMGNPDRGLAELVSD
ncbi:hypothetical protein GQ53DRAFT_758609 [Thozetella sp. PMI_491]|nr:hypothetical protein GQ53DRAFT_758609 [Thozetella sp. PMI_491]